VAREVDEGQVVWTEGLSPGDQATDETARAQVTRGDDIDGGEATTDGVREHLSEPLGIPARVPQRSEFGVVVLVDADDEGATSSRGWSILLQLTKNPLGHSGHRSEAKEQRQRGASETHGGVTWVHRIVIRSRTLAPGFDANTSASVRCCEEMVRGETRPIRT
jgi:hypothetical protein